MVYNTHALSVYIVKMNYVRMREREKKGDEVELCDAS